MLWNLGSIKKNILQISIKKAKKTPFLKSKCNSDLGKKIDNSRQITWANKWTTPVFELLCVPNWKITNYKQLYPSHYIKQQSFYG